MAGIYNNVNNAYSVNNKKITSKLAFNVGDKFNGKIIKKSDSGAAVIKLSDGWEFPAEVEGDLSSLKEGMAKFEVQGYKDGKLQLKLVSKDVGEESKPSDDLLQIIEKDGLDKEDISILKRMLKFNIPLTKENVREVRGLAQFINKINANPKEMDAFIEKYLQSNNISSDSDQGKLIANELKQFFNNLKSLTSEDIMFFLENDLDFDSETITSYNKFLKGNTDNIVEELKVINNNIKDIESSTVSSNKNNLDINSKINNDTTSEKVHINVENKSVQTDSYLNSNIKIVDSELDGIDIKTIDTNINNKSKLEVNEEGNSSTGSLASKAYEKQESGAKVDILSILKTISNNPSEEPSNIGGELKSTFNNILSKFGESSITEEQIIDGLKNFIQEGKDISKITKQDVENILSKITNKNIKLSDDDFNSIKTIIDDKLVDKIETSVNKPSVENIKEVIKDITIDKVVTQTLVKESIMQKGEEAKEVLKNIINNIKYQGDGAEKILDVIKNSMSDIKLMNKVNNEYYYFDSPVRVMDREYPCKLIVKDNRKDGKKIDSKNVKIIVSVKTINIGEVDAFIKVLDKNMFIELKCEEGFVSKISSIKDNLSSVIEKIGYTTNISVDKKEEPVNIINCRGFFNENNRTNLDIKV
ncbi:MAG: hypothetical protein RR620_14230 [Clostridium sp.]